VYQNNLQITVLSEYLQNSLLFTSPRSSRLSGRVLCSWCVGFDPTSPCGHDHSRQCWSVGGGSTGPGQISWSPGVGGELEVAAKVRGE